MRVGYGVLNLLQNRCSLYSAYIYFTGFEKMLWLCVASLKHSFDWEFLVPTCITPGTVQMHVCFQTSNQSALQTATHFHPLEIHQCQQVQKAGNHSASLRLQSVPGHYTKQTAPWCAMIEAIRLHCRAFLLLPSTPELQVDFWSGKRTDLLMEDVSWRCIEVCTHLKMDSR